MKNPKNNKTPQKSTVFSLPWFLVSKDVFVQVYECHFEFLSLSRCLLHQDSVLPFFSMSLLGIFFVLSLSLFSLPTLCATRQCTQNLKFNPTFISCQMERMHVPLQIKNDQKKETNLKFVFSAKINRAILRLTIL